MNKELCEKLVDGIIVNLKEPLSQETWDLFRKILYSKDMSADKNVTGIILILLTNGFAKIKVPKYNLTAEEQLKVLKNEYLNHNFLNLDYNDSLANISNIIFTKY
jgi:hypothetical protein